MGPASALWWQYKPVVEVFNWEDTPLAFGVNDFFTWIQSGASSPAKHGDAYFSAVYGSIKYPIAAPGLFDIQVP